MVSSGSMRRWLLWCSVALPLVASDPTDLLSTIKKRDLELQRQKNAAESTQLELSWINPVTLSYTDSRNDQFKSTQKRRELVVSVDQPIFKSGGIWAAIEYAKANRKVGDLTIASQERRLIKEVVAALFNLRKNTLQIEKQKLLVANDRIDIERKKERYLSGDLDSGFMDQAILKKNQDTLQLYALQDSRAQLYKRFKDLSDADPTTLKLPTFQLMSKEAFLKRHIDVTLEKEKVEKRDYFKTMTYARYLPTLSLQASYVKPYENNFYYTGGNLFDLTHDYHTYGFRITMPVDINSLYTIESAKVDYLSAKVALLDRRREAGNTYEAALKRLDVLERMIALAKEDERLYTSLVDSTQEKLEAGELTVYDLKTMKNSKKIRQIDQRIFAIDKQLVLLDLFEKYGRE